MLSNKAIEEFRSIYKKVYSKELAFDDAKRLAEKLIELFIAVYKPIPINKKTGVPHK